MVTAPSRAVSGRWPAWAPARRWLVLLGVVVALLGAYLATPHLVRLEADAAPRFSPGAAVTVPSYGERGTHILAYRYGEEFTIGVPVTNSGVVPVEVTEIRLTDEPRPLVETTSVRAEGSPLPTTLWPGETVRIELRARFDNCRYYHEREMQTMPGLVVDGRVLGLPATASARLDHDLVAHSPMIIGCPDRTLVRGDDRRR